MKNDWILIENTQILSIHRLVNRLKSLKNDKSYCRKLEEDYKTYYFGMVGRMFSSDNNNENYG